MANYSSRVADPSSTPRWNRFRLVALLGLLAVLGGVAWRSWEWNSRIKQVQKLLQLEENRLAISVLDDLKARFGDREQIRLLLAHAYRQLGIRDSFERQLELGQALGLSAETVQSEKLLFDAQLGLLKDPEAQVANYMETHAEDFDDASRALVLGLLRNQKIEAVERFLPLWESQSPDAAWIPTFRSMIPLMRRDWKKALESIEPALEKHPEFVPLYLQAGTAYQGDQQLERAESMLDRYLQSEPENAEALLRYTEVLGKLGKASEALDRIEQNLGSLTAPSLKIQPALRMQIAKLYLDVDRNQKVIEIIEGVAKQWPEDVEVASTLAQAYQRLGDEQRSASYAAIADAGQKETVLADRMLFELLSNPNRTAQQCYQLGHLLLHKQSRENGIYWLEAALQIDERFEPAHRDLALYYDRTGQSQLAAVHKRYLSE